MPVSASSGSGAGLSVAAAERLCRRHVPVCGLQVLEGDVVGRTRQNIGYSRSPLTFLKRNRARTFYTTAAQTPFASIHVVDLLNNLLCNKRTCCPSLRKICTISCRFKVLSSLSCNLHSKSTANRNNGAKRRLKNTSIEGMTITSVKKLCE